MILPRLAEAGICRTGLKLRFLGSTAPGVPKRGFNSNKLLRCLLVTEVSGLYLPFDLESLEIQPKKLCSVNTLGAPYQPGHSASMTHHDSNQSEERGGELQRGTDSVLFVDSSIQFTNKEG